MVEQRPSLGAQGDAVLFVLAGKSHGHAAKRVLSGRTGMGRAAQRPHHRFCGISVQMIIQQSLLQDARGVQQYDSLRNRRSIENPLHLLSLRSPSGSTGIQRRLARKFGSATLFLEQRPEA